MPAPYNFTNYTGANSFLDIIKYLNAETEHMFGIGIIVSLFIILFVLTNKYGEPAKSAAVSLFICTILSWFLMIMGLIPELVVFIFTIFTIIVGALLYAS